MRNLLVLAGMWVLFTTTSLALGPEWTGKPAPDFTLKTIDGRASLSLHELQGSVVVIDFWASWCAPCRRSLPLLASLEASRKGVKVLAINIDDERKNGVEFLKRIRSSLVALYDEQKKVVTKYDVPSMPSAIIIDRHGIVRFIHAGYTENDLAEFRKEIDALL